MGTMNRGWARWEELGGRRKLSSREVGMGSLRNSLARTQFSGEWLLEVDLG